MRQRVFLPESYGINKSPNTSQALTDVALGVTKLLGKKRKCVLFLFPVGAKPRICVIRYKKKSTGVPLSAQLLEGES